MNGLEKITDRITADAREKAADIVAQAKTRAEEITAEYQSRADALLADERAKAETLAAQTAQRAEAAGGLEGRKWILSAKQQLLEDTFTLALDKLCALSKEEYTALLTKLLTRAAQGGEEVIFNQADRALVGKDAVTAANEALKDGRLTLSEETRDIKGGFILKSGLVELNCALETLVEQEKEAMSVSVAAHLFPRV